ncbi:hypothetical protein GOBAR_DD36179 [Gossypium barbadense]|nr:hypothetical protein GOBAR_DD36179 [Gossypium barbadense]
MHITRDDTYPFRFDTYPRLVFLIGFAPRCHHMCACVPSGVFAYLPREGLGVMPRKIARCSTSQGVDVPPRKVVKRSILRGVDIPPRKVAGGSMPMSTSQDCEGTTSYGPNFGSQDQVRFRVMRLVSNIKRIGGLVHLSWELTREIDKVCGQGIWQTERF